jgi:hypothetical protein
MAKKWFVYPWLILLLMLGGCGSTTKVDTDALRQLIEANATLAAIERGKSESNSSEVNPIPSPTAIPDGVEVLFQPTQSKPDPTNLVQNGYFLEDYDYWTRDLADEGGSSKISITNSNNSIVDRALNMEQSGLGHLVLSQKVKINDIDLNFSATFHTTSSEGLIWGFSGSGYAIVGLGYIDSNGDHLGYTRIMNINESIFAGTAFIGAPESISDTNNQHNIMIESGKLYSHYSLNVKQEIESNLLGIDPSEVAYIEIVLIVGSNDKDAGASLKISDIVLH